MHACMLISNIAGSDPARRKSVSLIPGAHARPNPPDKWIFKSISPPPPRPLPPSSSTQPVTHSGSLHSAME